MFLISGLTLTKLDSSIGPSMALLESLSTSFINGLDLVCYLFEECSRESGRGKFKFRNCSTTIVSVSESEFTDMWKSKTVGSMMLLLKT